MTSGAAPPPGLHSAPVPGPAIVGNQAATARAECVILAVTGSATVEGSWMNGLPTWAATVWVINKATTVVRRDIFILFMQMLRYK